MAPRPTSVHAVIGSTTRLRHLECAPPQPRHVAGEGHPPRRDVGGPLEPGPRRAERRPRSVGALRRQCRTPDAAGQRPRL